MKQNCRLKVSTKVSTNLVERLSSVLQTCHPPLEWNLLALQPHTRGLQPSRHTIPHEVLATAEDRIHGAVGALSVPESTAAIHRAVGWVEVVVTVVRGEHHTILVDECIAASVTRVTSHVQCVVGSMRQYYERTVLGIVPFAVATWLQVELQLVRAVECQLTEQFVAQPVVASGVVESDSELRPRTIEEVGPVNVLLDQQRNAVGYRAVINISKLQVSCMNCWQQYFAETIYLAADRPAVRFAAFHTGRV